MRGLLTDGTFLDFGASCSLQAWLPAKAVPAQIQYTNPHRALRFHPASVQLYFFCRLLVIFHKGVCAKKALAMAVPLL